MDYLTVLFVFPEPHLVKVTFRKGWWVTDAVYLAGEFALFFSSVACASIS